MDARKADRPVSWKSDRKLADGCAEPAIGAGPTACGGSLFDRGDEPVRRTARLGQHVDQRGQSLNRFAFIGARQEPNSSFVVDDARGLGLTDDMLGDHVDEEFLPLRRIVHLGSDDREQFIGGFARNLPAREHFALQPRDILRRHASAEDHRADDRPAPVDCEGHHTHLHSIRFGLWRQLGCLGTLRLNNFRQVNPPNA
jgi:hypothetical protein